MYKKTPQIQEKNDQNNCAPRFNEAWAHIQEMPCELPKAHQRYFTQSCSSSSSSLSLLWKLVIVRVYFIGSLTLFLLVVLPFVLLPCCVLANSKLPQNFNILAKFLPNTWKTLAYTTAVNFPLMMQWQSTHMFGCSHSSRFCQHYQMLNLLPTQLL